MDTEGLCGMLPLAVGMPVALTQHVDRSEKALLKGRVAHVHSWDWPENDQQPRLVRLGPHTHTHTHRDAHEANKQEKPKLDKNEATAHM